MFGFVFLKVGSHLADPTSLSHGSGSTCPALLDTSLLLSLPCPPSSCPVLNPAHSRMMETIQNAITARIDDLSLPQGLGLAAKQDNLK